jgi:broad specificity phosphatase PhoE
LSRLGEQQAHEMAARRADDDIVRAFSSDLTRAVRTAEIALAKRAVPLVRDRRLRECNYGTLTQAAASEIEARRLVHVTIPFPNGESYTDVVARIDDWLHEVAPGEDAGGVILLIGHRATFYALEHLLRGIPLADIISAPWRWQPGWTYQLQGFRARPT